MQPFLDKWATEIVDTIPNIFIALVIFVAFFYLARGLADIIRVFLRRRGVVSHVVDLLARLVYWMLLVVGIVMALQRFFDVTAFLAGLGIIGFTVGFALQDVMKNFAAGIILLLQQPFRVGEAISVAGFDGTILAVDLRATEMSTFDGRLVSIPNAIILTNPITNFTRAAHRRVEVSLPVALTDDVEATRKAVLNAIQHAPGVLSDPAPTVTLQEIGASSMNLVGSFWVDVTKGSPDAARDAALTQIQASARQSVPLTGRADGQEQTEAEQPGD